MNDPELLPREIQLVGAAILVIFLGWLIYLVRTQSVTLRDSLVWILSTLGALGVTVFPGALATAGHSVGIQLPSNAVFAVAILYLTFNLLSVTIASSVNASNVRRLTQECTLLRGELELLRSEHLENAERAVDDSNAQVLHRK